MARVSFVISRLNFFKTLGGVIDEAMKRGHSVSLLYDRLGVGKKLKNSLLPEPRLFPKFRFGVPKVVAYEGITALSQAAQKCSDVVVLHCGCISDYEQYLENPDTYAYQHQAIRKSSIPVVSLHSHFYDSCGLKLNAYESVDLTCVLSDYTYAAQKEVLLEASGLQGEERQSYRNRIDTLMRQRVVVTGSALFDMFDDFYKSEKRKPAKDLVLMVPVIDNPFMNVVARDQPVWRAALASILRYRGEHLWKIFSYPTLGAVFKGIQELTQRNGLDLISKSRPKNAPFYEEMLRGMSKQHIDGHDDSFYPDFSSLRILQEARCCFNIWTSSVMEAVLAGVPSFSIHLPPIMRPENYPEDYSFYIKTIYSGEPDTIFNFEGCVWSIPWKDSIQYLRDVDMNTVAIDPGRRDKYVRYFCGAEDIPAAARQMDVVESLL